jgi:hypothetical protein
MQHPSDGCADQRAVTEGDANPRTGAMHVLPELLAGPAPSLQAQPFCGVATDEDFR